MKKAHRDPTRGQTLVEFALIIPIFLFLAVVIFDFGRGVYYYSAIHNAAREGARYGVVNPDVADYPAIEAVAIKYAIGLGLTPADVTAGPGAPENVGGVNNPTIKVTVTYDFTPVTPFVENLLPCGCGFITLTSDAIMRTESLPSP